MSLRSIAGEAWAAMRRRAVLRPVLASMAGFCALVVTVLLLAGSFGAADPAGSRIPFQIATGTTGGAFFPVGEAIAGLISHPPGVDRCNKASVCGPPGLIITARSSSGTVDNVMAVNAGTADSGLARADVVAAAAKGEEQFRRGKATHVRVIASLFSENVHVVVATKAKIAGIADLRGKRVSLGSDSSGVSITAHEILAAYHVPESSLKIVRSDLLGAVQMLQAGKLDAVFTVGSVPVTQVTGVLASGKARLLPIDGAGRDRLLKMTPTLAKGEIAANAYQGQGATQTVSTQAVWIVRDSAPEALVYGITRALFDPANRDGLAASHPAAREIGLSTAALNPPAPLHPGAARFYNEVRR
jgi:TRAP transporter TAXI family solute receptor